MINPQAGEVAVTVDGELFAAKLTLGALAALEAELDEGGLIELVERFETGRYRGRDVLALIVAGLRGGGWKGQIADLVASDICGGPIGAAQVAAELLARAFVPPA